MAVAKATRFVRTEDAGSDWIVVDAAGQRLGRLASLLAHRLRGKHRADFTPHVDLGDHIVVINADSLVVTGRKEKQKIYYRHTGYPGGIKQRTFTEAMELSPEKVLLSAVRGMLPRTPLGRSMLTKLRVYSGPDHPHAAQKPSVLEVAE